MPRPPRPSSLRLATRHRSTADILGSIWGIVLAMAVLGGFYWGRDFLIPLALAVLITFLMSPLVSRLSRWVGNVVAVVIAMLLILGAAVGLAWSVGVQAVDFAEQLPSYKENIRGKIREIRGSGEGTLSRLSETVDDLEKELPGNEGSGPTALILNEPIRVTTESGSVWKRFRMLATPVVGPLGTAALVFLLAAFMLLKREDLRGRLIRLVGQGRISATTKALDDAGSRVRRYLLMQLVINVTYGIPLAIGLHFIGVPNAVLWGALAAALRFIPYLGPWIAAIFPVLLSLAVSPSWVMPLQVIALIVVLELISNNILEPWLYGSSTGVSPVALIVSAVFWTWLWGPVGLLLSTPFTVCLVVMGRHIPQLSFLSVVLGEEEALTPAEECYHLLLRAGGHDETVFAENFLSSWPLVELYDSVLIPVLIATAEDHRTGAIDREQMEEITAAIGELLTDLGERPALPKPEGWEEKPLSAYRVQCFPARAARDDLAGVMAAQVLLQQGLDAAAASVKRNASELVGLLERDSPDLVCISVVSPSRPLHARNLFQRISQALPGMKVVVGLWGRDDENLDEDIKSLRGFGAEDVFTRIADFTAYVERSSRGSGGDSKLAGKPEDEDLRLQTLARLNLVNDEPEPALEHLTRKLTRAFGAPIAAITLVDRDFQWFKASDGLPPALTRDGPTPRDASICAHVVATNGTLVIRDLRRDPRSAKLPLVHDHGIRFYAGTPIRAANGQPLGALCLMGDLPRGFTPQEKRMLEASAAEVGEEIERMTGSAV